MSIITKSIFVTLVLVAVALLPACNDSNGTGAEVDWLAGEWDWVRSCGGCLPDCSYPSYLGEIVVTFKAGVYHKIYHDSLIEWGSYKYSHGTIDGFEYYTLDYDNKNYSTTVYVNSESELVIVGTWGVYTQYFKM